MEENLNQNQQKPNFNQLMIPIAIVVAGVIIGGAIFVTAKFSQKNLAAGSAQAPQKVNVSIDDDPALGNSKAPITMIEFSDFQCPFCGRFFNDTELKIIEKYVKTGKVYLVYRDFPISSIHSYAEKAAEAGECAHEQNKFWQLHDLIFQNQLDLTVSALKKYAGRVSSLDVNKFSKCLDSGKYRNEVAKDVKDGEDAGVRGTPTFFINGTALVGAQPFDVFEQILDGLLKK